MKTSTTLFWASLLSCFTIGARAQQLTEAVISAGKVSTFSYEVVQPFDLADSLVGVMYIRKNTPQWQQEIYLYRKQDLSLFKKWVHSPVNSGPVAQRAFQNAQQELCFYTNSYYGDVNHINISRVNGATLDRNYVNFQVPGHYRKGFLYVNGELVLTGRAQGPDLDTIHLEVYDLNGQRLRHKSYTSTGDPFPDGPLNTYTISDPKLHPLSGELVFVEGRGCNYTIVSLNSLDILESQRDTNYFGDTEQLLGTVNFELTPQGVECGGFGWSRDYPVGNDFDLQFHHAFRQWGDTNVTKSLMGPHQVDNIARDFKMDKARATRFLAGGLPFDGYNIPKAEQREVLLYRLNVHGTDSILLYGQKNHVPYWIHPDEGGDVFLFSTYTESWTTDTTYYLFTKIPGFAISLIEEGKTQGSIELYPNPTTDYLQIDRLREEVLQMEIYSQSGQLLKSTPVTQDLVDIRDLSPGLYIVVVTNPQGQRSQVLVKKE